MAWGRPFTSTFLEWFATAHLSDNLRPEPRRDRGAVELHFLVGDGALEG
ncbi:hypothetical protein GGR39_003405 [Novosphingobium fluoreni]|uniref:Uncharacterized protein n=1 Tax=Novosphingobium fluoreni TaxID=1391222 RepID=A0A7W6C4V2_9SPHN|nr:hypothetical protein [Novosphingobium fluoreni]MBB3941724.1 hypothetical protein [Novosphingobium fluoreni]